MSGDWREAQGLDEYADYQRRRAEDTARQEKREVHTDLAGGGFDADLLRTNRSPSPIRLTWADRSQLLDEERRGLVEITRDESGEITSIQRINKIRNEPSA